MEDEMGTSRERRNMQGRFLADTMQCRLGVYPFMFSKYEDFLPIVDQLIKVGSLR